MNSRTRMSRSLFGLLAVSLVALSTAYAAPIRVDCGRGGSISSTLASLVSAGNTRGITIFVTGTCKENILIGAFDHLTLQALPVASIEDTSNGNAPVVEIRRSYDVTLQGFTIRGGSPGALCGHASFCTFYLNTVQQSFGDGVRFISSQGIVNSNNISSNAASGVNVTDGSTVRANSNTVGGNGYIGILVSGSAMTTFSNTVSGNGTAGMAVASGSNLLAQNDTIQNNAGQGIWVLKGAVLRAFDLTITGNNSAGVNLSQASSAAFEQDVIGNVITRNGGNGVSIGDLSFAEFDGMNNVSGNLTQPDVACNPQYSATRGAGTVGGTTNCVEPPRNQHLLPQAKADGLSDRP